MAGPPRNFRVLVVGYSCSAYGNYLNLVALSLFTLAVTGGPLGVGIVMALRLGAGFGTGLVAGWLVNRFDRRRLMIGTDLAQATAMVALAAGPANVGLLVAAAVVLGAGNALFNVALRSSVPAMVGQDQRVGANGQLVTGRSIGTVLGFASAGVIVASGGFAAAFYLNAASFVVSAMALVVLRLPTRADDDSTGTATGTAPGRPERTLLALAGPVVVLMIAVRGADAFGSASHNMALPLYASRLDGAEPAVVMSQFWASWAVGTLLAHQVLRRWRHGEALGERAFGLGTCLMSVGFVLAFAVPAGPALIAVALLAGLADGWTEIVYTSRLQAAPDKQRGRLFGMSATAETAGFAVGMLSSSAVLEAAPEVTVVAIFHGVAFLAATALLAVAFALRRATAPAGSVEKDVD
ncbi:MFS transporter [Actinophytocola gossypii]|uniref:MFS transporter n=1 Tax=Actinophytocola gossypii TaxID=2812003 RepID=A0ABT2J2T7_9PSEU|nr:MFS transporter [Actinophytocola gossypii]MCT2582173.1 MFS transporter [Actinophytocola gossypii]